MNEIDSNISTDAKDAALVLKTAGQRRINFAWEITQSIIAVTITFAMIYCAVMKIESVILGNAFTLITALYFVRMNHTKTGGVGSTDHDHR